MRQHGIIFFTLLWIHGALGEMYGRSKAVGFNLNAILYRGNSHQLDSYVPQDSGDLQNEAQKASEAIYSLNLDALQSFKKQVREESKTAKCRNPEIDVGALKKRIHSQLDEWSKKQETNAYKRGRLLSHGWSLAGGVVEQYMFRAIDKSAEKGPILLSDLIRWIHYLEQDASKDLEHVKKSPEFAVFLFNTIRFFPKYEAEYAGFIAEINRIFDRKDSRSNHRLTKAEKEKIRSVESQVKAIEEDMSHADFKPK